MEHKKINTLWKTYAVSSLVIMVILKEFLSVLLSNWTFKKYYTSFSNVGIIVAVGLAIGIYKIDTTNIGVLVLFSNVASIVAGGLATGVYTTNSAECVR